MAQESHKTDWYVLMGESDDAFPALEELPDDEEYDDERGVTGTVKQYCPKCSSTIFEPYIQGKLNVLRCKVCGSLLCPKCAGLLESYVTNTGQKTLRCKKHGLNL